MVGDFGRAHLVRRPSSQLRHKIVVQHRRIAGGGLRLALWLGMLVDEKFNELRDRHCRIGQRPLLGGVFPGGNSPENSLRLGARLVWRYHSMSPQHHEAPRTGPPRATRSIAEDVSLGPALRDPQPNPFNSASQTIKRPGRGVAASTVSLVSLADDWTITALLVILRGDHMVTTAE